MKLKMTALVMSDAILLLRVRDSLRRSEEFVKKSRFAPFNAIIIV